MKVLSAFVCLSLILMLCVLAGCAATPAATPGGARIVSVPAEKVAQCAAQGGCAYLSRQQAEDLLETGFEAGVQSCSRKGAI